MLFVFMTFLTDFRDFSCGWRLFLLKYLVLVLISLYGETGVVWSFWFPDRVWFTSIHDTLVPKLHNSVSHLIRRSASILIKVLFINRLDDLVGSSLTRAVVVNINLLLLNTFRQWLIIDVRNCILSHRSITLRYQYLLICGVCRLKPFVPVHSPHAHILLFGEPLVKSILHQRLPVRASVVRIEFVFFLFKFPNEETGLGLLINLLLTAGLHHFDALLNFNACIWVLTLDVVAFLDPLRILNVRCRL